MRGILLNPLVVVVFRHFVLPQALLAIKRMCHRGDVGRVDRLQLVDEPNDVGELRANVRHLFVCDFQPRKYAKLVDVFSVE